MRPAPRRLGHRHMSRAAFLIPLLVLGALAVVPTGVAAFPLTTCTLALTSTTADGQVLDSAFNGGADSTQSDPFFADWNGVVRWRGTSGPSAFRDNSWHVEIFMVPTTLRGGDANQDGTRQGNGVISAGNAGFFRLTGLYYISGEFSGDGGRCTASGWVRLEGFPLVTLPFWIAVAVLVIGIVLLTTGYRRAWGLAIPAGFIAGLGLSFVVIMFGILPFGAWTPYGVVLAMLLVGVLVALLAAHGRPRPL